MSSPEHSPEEKTSTNWEAIERDFRMGVRAVTAIASEYGITEGAIRKRAKKLGWVRDLNAKVRAKADDLVRKAEVRAQVREGQRLTESREIEVEATIQRDVRMGQKSDIKRTRLHCMKLLDELERQTDQPELFEQVEQILAQHKEGGELAPASRAKLQGVMNKALSLGNRAGTMRSLAESLRILVALEREAFGIDAHPDAGEGEKEFLERLLNARRRAANR